MMPLQFKRIVSFLCVMTLVFSISFLGNQFARAAFTPEINYQGKLLDSTGAAVPDGTYEMTFSLYTVSSGGSPIWTEMKNGSSEIEVTSGLFSVMLGNGVPFTGVDFDQPLYLGITIEGDSEMTPRKVLGAVPAAFVAENANALGSATSTQYLRSDVVGLLSVSSSSTGLIINQAGTGDILNLQDGGSEVLTVLDGGNVGIGTTTPGTKLAVAGTSRFTGASIFDSTLSVTGLTTLVNASTTNLTISGNSYLGTVQSGTWNGSVISSTYLDSSLILSSEIDTSSELSGIITDETGSGSLVFGTSPTFTTNANFFGDTISDFTGTGLEISSGALTVATSSLGITSSQWTTSGQDIYYSTAGNVGIGTTTPDAKLTVQDGLAVGGLAFQVIGGTGVGVFNGTGVDGSGIEMTAGTGGASSLGTGGNGGNIVFNPGAAGTGGSSAGSVGNIILANLQGNVGVGTTTPETALSVDGDFSVTGGLYLPGGFEMTYDDPTETLSILNPSSVWAHIRVRDITATEVLGALTLLQAPLLTNVTELTIQATTDLGEDTTITMDSNISYFTGNIGIGTTTPGSRLVVGSGQIEAPSASSVSAPAYSFSGDLNTGMYQSAANSLDFAVNGTNYLTVSSAGTFSMASANAIRAANGSAATPFYSFTNATDAGMAKIGTGSQLSFVTTGTERIRIDASGNVGIGTTTPDVKFQVSGGSIKLDNGQKLVWRNAAGTANQNVLHLDSLNNAVITSGTGALALYDGSLSHRLDIYSGGTVATRIQSSGASYLNGGSLGIGTTNPGATLDVSNGASTGSFKIGADVNANTRTTNTRQIGRIVAPTYAAPTSQNFFLISADSDSTYNSVVFGGNVGSATYAATDLGFMTASTTSTGGGTVRMSIDRNGNVAVGSHTPTGRFEVRGAGTTTGVTLGLTNSAASPLFTVYDNGNALFGSTSGGGTATPMNVSFGATYGTNTPGSSGNLKWTMYDAGVSSSFYGIGMSAGLMEFRAGSGAALAFFPNNGVQAMRLMSSGRVAVGTHTNPLAKVSLGTDIGAKLGLYDDGTNIYGLGIQAALLQVYVPNTSADIAFGYGTSTSLTRLMTIKGTGNVGIGTSTPSDLLTVAGSANLTGALKFSGDAGTSGYVLQSTGTSAQWVATSTLGISGGSSQWDSVTGGINYAGGNVGIGNANPLVALDIVQSAPIIRLTSDSESGYIASGYIGADEFGLYAGINDEKIATYDSNMTTYSYANGNLTSDGSNVRSYLSLMGTRVTMDFGDATAPAYSFVGDDNTGIFRSASDTLGFGTASTQRMTIDATGNVGIATTTPGEKLTVAGNINLTGALKFSGDAGTSGYVLQSTGTSAQWVATSTLGISGGGGSSQWTTSGSDIHFATGRAAVGTTTFVGRAALSVATSSAEAGVSGYGVYAEASMSGYESFAYGGYFKGKAAADDVDVYGVYGAAELSTLGSNGYGVYGTVSGGDSIGTGVGGFGYIGVEGFSTSDSGYGFYGVSTGSSGYGVYSSANSSSGTGVRGDAYYGIFGASNNSTGRAGYFNQSNAAGYSLYATGGINYVQNNLGIGTTTPAAKLAITGTAGTGDLFVVASSTNARYLTMNSLGNLGLGTLPSARAHFLSTTEQLRVGYDASNYYSTTIDSTGTVTFDAVGANSRFNFMDNIGINNSSPAVEFEINGNNGAAANITLTRDDTSTVLNDELGSLNFGSEDGPSAISASINAYAAESFSSSNSGTYITFELSPVGSDTNAEAMRITATGTVGIGTTNAIRKLHVRTTADEAPVRFEDSSGYCEINPISTTWSCTSDERLKENIRDLIMPETSTNPDATALELLADLRPVTFTWKTDGSHGDRTGLIAQEVEKIFPDLVNTDERGYKSVSYGGFTVYLISAMKEILTRLESVESFVSNATGTVTANISSGISAVVEKLTVGSAEKPTGITLYDEETGEPYCLKIKGGETQTTPGECSVVDLSQPEPEPVPAPDTTNPAPGDGTQTSGDQGTTGGDTQAGPTDGQGAGDGTQAGTGGGQATGDGATGTQSGDVGTTQGDTTTGGGTTAGDAGGASAGTSGDGSSAGTTSGTNTGSAGSSDISSGSGSASSGGSSGTSGGDSSASSGSGGSTGGSASGGDSSGDASTSGGDSSGSAASSGGDSGASAGGI